MTSAHTPGPWHYEQASSSHRVLDSDNVLITEVESDLAENEDRYEADARLIASAPDLLAENTRLREALKQLNHVQDGGYCICPLNDGLSITELHSTCCADIRAILERQT